MSVTGPVAADVRQDEMGAFCRRCLMPVVLHRIDRGQPVYRHVIRKPPCLFDSKGQPR